MAASDSAPGVDRFQISGEGFEPAYLALHRSGELMRRARLAVDGMSRCLACPQECGADRLQDEAGFCRVGRHAVVSSFFAHTGEEDCLRGWNGSGTIFFAGCNLGCVFCQNAEISRGMEGAATPPERLAAMMLELQVMGCHNINFVSPEHVVPHILEALPLAVEAGLRLPIVYNTSAYDSLDSLRLLDGAVDIYMPDFKFWDKQLAARYLQAEDYPEVARAAIREMYRQVGDLKLDENGVARRGLLVRHLVMPGCVEDSRAVLRFLAHQISPVTYINLMDQYRPDHRVDDDSYSEINRRITRQEYRVVVDYARQVGLRRLDERRGWQSRL